MKRIRNVIITCLIACLVVTLMPVNVFASEVNEEQTEALQQSAETVSAVSETEESASEDDAEQVTEADKQTEEIIENDDPGNGRLEGIIAPEFYDEVATFMTRAGYTHNSKFDGYEIQKGIDVSHHNGTIDWAKVKAAGVEFAIIRVGYRGYSGGTIGSDTKAITNLKGAIAAGVPVGVYIYSQAISEDEAREEANYVLDVIDGYDVTLPIVMDYEYYSSSSGNDGRLYNAKLTKREATDNCLAFCEVVKAAGYDPMVYANKSFLADQLYASELSKECEIWLAHYTTSTSYSGDYNYWQYSSSGSVNGISTAVDLNFRYIEPNEYSLKVEKTTVDSVQLQWNMDETVSGYEVAKKNSGGEYETIAEIEDASTVTYTDTGLEQGTAYTYKVRSVYVDENDEKTYAEYSEEVTAVTGIDATTTITSASSTFDSVTLKWEKADNVTGYQIQRYNTAKASYITVKNTTATSYTDTSLNCNITFKYRIRPYKTVGSKTVYGTYSAVKSIKSAAAATGVTSSKVNIRKGASTSYAVLKTVSKGTKLSLTGSSGDWYRVSITISGSTKTGYIMKKYVTVASIPAKPTVTAKGTAFDKVKLTWKKVSGASGYVVQRYNSSSKKYVTIKTITSGSTVSYTNSSLNCSTTYKYRVCAYRTYHGTKIYGSYSSVVSGKTTASVTGKTTSKLKIRKGAGTSYGVYKTVKKGTKLTITGSNGSWYRVSIKVSGKKKNAYVMKKYVKLI